MWRWINPHNQRYYQADLVLDLFGDWTLICAWGGRATRRGNHSITGVCSHADGLRKIENLGVQRKKRGYIAVPSFAGWTTWIAATKVASDLPPNKRLQGKDIPEEDFVLEQVEQGKFRPLRMLTDA